MWTLSGAGVSEVLTGSTSVVQGVSFVATGSGTMTLTCTCGGGVRSVSTTFTVLPVIAFELVDEEGDIDGDPNAQDASGIDMSSLSFTLNGFAVAPSRWTVTDVTGQVGSATAVLGKRIRFTPLASELAASGDNIVVISVKDKAGNPIDPSTNTLHITFGTPAATTAAAVK